MNNISFYKKYNKLIIFFIICLMPIICFMMYGLVNGDFTKPFKKMYEDYVALNNPKQYLEEVIFAVDTVFIYRSSSRDSSEKIIIRGNLLHSKEKQELSRNYDRDYYNDKDTINPNDEILYDTNYHIIDGKKVTLLKILKNKINNSVFMKDKRKLDSQKYGTVIFLCIILISILLFVILLILKIKSR